MIDTRMRETLKLVGETLYGPGDQWFGKLAMALRVHPSTVLAVYEGREEFNDKPGILAELLRLVQKEAGETADARDKAHAYMVERGKRWLDLCALAFKLSETRP